MSSYNAPVVSPYDPSVPDYQPDTPPLDEVIRDAIDGFMLENHNKVMAANIIAINSSGQNGGSQNVDVQPLPKVLYADSKDPVDRPIIHQVPVMMLAGSTYFIKVPFSVGDTGILLFSDRSIDNFLSSDGSTTYDPGDVRRHDYNDAIFLPGLPTFTTQIEDTTTDLVINSGDPENDYSQVRLLQNGKVQIQNNQGQELIDLLDQLMSQLGTFLGNLQQAMVLTSFGPAPFIASSIAQFAQVQQQIQTIQQNLDTLKV